MKKLAVVGMLAVTAVSSQAQEYIGLSVGKAFFGGSCGAASCDAGGVSGKLTVGAPLTGVVRTMGLSSYELSYSQWGGASRKYSAVIPNDPGITIVGDYDEHRHASSIAGGLVV